MKIPYLTLVAGQQGGIGYPPVIVKFKNRWYGIKDSRERKIPEELENILYHVSRFKSPYGYKPNPEWHSQEFVWKKWHKNPQLTWVELLKRVNQSLVELEIEGSKIKIPKNNLSNFLEDFKLPYE